MFDHQTAFRLYNEDFHSAIDRVLASDHAPEQKYWMLTGISKACVGHLSARQRIDEARTELLRHFDYNQLYR